MVDRVHCKDITNKCVLHVMAVITFMNTWMLCLVSSLALKNYCNCQIFKVLFKDLFQVPAGCSIPGNMAHFLSWYYPKPGPGNLQQWSYMELLGHLCDLNHYALKNRDFVLLYISLKDTCLALWIADPVPWHVCSQSPP